MLAEGKVFAGCVMADKGFLIKNDLPPGEELVVPPFLRDLQITADKVRQTYKIATARVHVERANKRTKTFPILDEIPYEYFHLASVVFQLIGALSNLQAPIIAAVADSY